MTLPLQNVSHSYGALCGLKTDVRQPAFDKAYWCTDRLDRSEESSLLRASSLR
jgi:hypothetical protein